MSAIIRGGVSGVDAEVDGTVFRALRVTSRPVDYGTLGHYRNSTTIALVATQAANGTVWSFRWSDATRLCIPLFFRLACQQTAAATATIMPNFQAFVARSFSVSDSAGTALTLTGNSFKKRTSMGTTLVADIRKSAVAAGLTVGTRTLDADPFLELLTQQTITTPNQTTYQETADWSNAVDHPIVLAANEGIIVRGPTVVFGAAGTANLQVTIGWAEVAAY